MAPLTQASPIVAEILDTLPDAVDPLALSMNENPFPPPPAVRSSSGHATVYSIRSEKTSPVRKILFRKPWTSRRCSPTRREFRCHC
jgi:hypothetical protein